MEWGYRSPRADSLYWDMIKAVIVADIRPEKS